jgi:hypothetical protein
MKDSLSKEWRQESIDKAETVVDVLKIIAEELVEIRYILHDKQPTQRDA